MPITHNKQEVLDYAREWSERLSKERNEFVRSLSTTVKEGDLSMTEAAYFLGIAGHPSIDVALKNIAEGK